MSSLARMMPSTNDGSGHVARSKLRACTYPRPKGSLRVAPCARHRFSGRSRVELRVRSASSPPPPAVLIAGRAHDLVRAEQPRSQTSSVAAMDEFVASHSDAEVMENGKIRCTLTGHEVTPQLATVQAYWTGKKYRNAKARREYDYSQHEPYLVPHTKSEHLLYCTLTKQPVRPSAALASVQWSTRGVRAEYQ